MQSGGARGRGRARGRARAAQGAAEEPSESARPGAGEPGTQVITCSAFLLVDKRKDQPFRSRANSLPGAEVPIGPGQFTSWNFCSLELLFPGTFVPCNFHSLLVRAVDLWHVLRLMFCALSFLYLHIVGGA